MADEPNTPEPGLEQIPDDIRKRLEAIHNSGSGSINIRTVFLAVVILIGAVLAWTVLIHPKPKTTSSDGTTQQSGTADPNTPIHFTQQLITVEENEMHPAPIVNVTVTGDDKDAFKGPRLPIRKANPVPMPVNIAPPAPAPQPPPVPSPLPHPVPPQPAQHWYTVMSGDTLSAIAQRDHTNWQNVYALNKSIVDSTAIAHHLPPEPGDGYAHWIFPGERLLLPN